MANGESRVASGHQETSSEKINSFGIGQPVLRQEDRRLVTGAGCFTDDVRLPGELWGIAVRAPMAHGAIRDLAVTDAQAMPGVVAVLTAADLEAAGVQPFPCGLPHKSRDGSPLIVPDRFALSRSHVRHVGEAVAFIIAESEAQARDGAEAVVLDVEALPTVVDVEAAAAPGAPELHDDVPGNVVLDWLNGDAVAAETAFAEAAHVTTLAMASQRIAPAPLEPRAIVARFDTAEDRYELHTGCQGAFGLSGGLAGLLGLKRDRIRVLVGDVGGSFGMKAAVYPEYICALVGAKQTGRPVRWRDDRTESFLADHGGRDIRMTGELALDAEGRILAVRLSGFANMGAYLTGMAPHIGTVNIRKNAASLYRTPVMVIESKCVMTNTPPVGPYRGAGRPDGNYFMERLMDQAARETGRDPVELRRLNLIDAAEMPYEAVSGETYDSGDFAAVLDRALRDGDWDGFDARKDASEAAGKLRGRGIACYLEATAPQGKEMGGLRFGADGRITIVTGTLDYGQGHETAFAQVLSDKLGIDYDRIDLLQGDSSELLVGGGTGGSRSIMATGNAIFEAADAVIEKGTQLAAHALEAAAADIEWADGGFRVAGTDRSISLMDLAFETAGKTGEDQVLDANLVTLSPPSTYPNGCHICEVEIDPETGVTRIVSYTAVNDFGTIINPLLVDGQVHGGVVQGAGQVLLEGAVFDQDGQILNGSLMDYCLPRADDAPFFTVAYQPSPATTNPLGAKGCGEAGTTGALPAVANAVIDALATRGVTDIDLPATPQRVWSALNR